MTGKKLTGAKAAINFAKLAKKPWIHVGAHPSSSKRALRRMAAKAPGGAKQEREIEDGVRRREADGDNGAVIHHDRDLGQAVNANSRSAGVAEGDNEELKPCLIS
jgi:hypothetical protein